MKLLYAIQGTGNGHISRAETLVPLFQKFADTDVLISGTQSDLRPSFKINYKFQGLSYVFGKKGGVDLLDSFRRSHIPSYFKDLWFVPVEEYDCVINDFEPVSAWAARLKGVPCIGLSHQAAVLGEFAPKPKVYSMLSKLILQKYAPCDRQLGFHFKEYDSATFGPIIKNDIRNLSSNNLGHFTVYLPSYDDQYLIDFFSKFPENRFQIFSKHYSSSIAPGNIELQSVNEERFNKSMANAAGIICGAGFETPSEALFLNKKLLVIPMFNQFEQQCNALALKKMGAQVLPKLSNEFSGDFYKWLHYGKPVTVEYPDNSKIVVKKTLELAANLVTEQNLVSKKTAFFSGVALK